MVLTWVRHHCVKGDVRSFKNIKLIIATTERNKSHYYNQNNECTQLVCCKVIATLIKLCAFDRLLNKIYVKHNCFCYYLLYTKLHVSTYLSGHDQAFLQLSQRMLYTCWDRSMFTLLKFFLIMSVYYR